MEEYLEKSQEELQLLYHQGDKVALAVLHDRARTALEAYAAKIALKRPGLADQGMVNALERLDRPAARASYDPGRPWPSFAAVVVRRCVLDLLRTRRGREVSLDDGPIPIAAAADHDLFDRLDDDVAALVNEAFALLSDEEKEIVIAYELIPERSGRTMEEVAADLGEDFQVCKNRYRSAKARMRRHLNDRGVGSFTDV
jgi:RNA polymerase sigma factor (sigma-70 family)